jgi:hypothetical protein
VEGSPCETAATRRSLNAAALKLLRRPAAARDRDAGFDFVCGGEGVLSASVMTRAVPSSLMESRTKECVRLRLRVVIGGSEDVGTVMVGNAMISDV